MKTRVVAAKIENLDNVMVMVDEVLQAAACTERGKTYVCVSVEEIFTNIVSYAYSSGNVKQEKKVEISCGLLETAGETRLHICFRDWGKAYNPLERPSPDFGIPFEERPIGGLGIYMVKNFMDHVEYRHEDGCNILTIEKILSGGKDGTTV